ncbi:His-Xaa-Ser repeat protein HxsA [Halomonas sp. AOP5-B2-8]
MKLLTRWKFLLGQTMALIPMVGAPFAYAGPEALEGFEWGSNSGGESPVFRNTLNAEDVVNLYAAHRSHSSHRSHRSHSSHYSGSSGYSAPRSTYTPPPTRSVPNTTNSSAGSSTSSSPSSSAGSNLNSDSSPSLHSSDSSRVTPLRRPDSGDLAELITRVQTALMIKGYYNGALDGIMGSQTRGALMSFQADSGIEVNGRMDTPTLNALGIVIR